MMEVKLHRSSPPPGLHPHPVLGKLEVVAGLPDKMRNAAVSLALAMMPLFRLLVVTLTLLTTVVSGTSGPNVRER